MNRESAKVSISATPDAIKHKREARRYSTGKVDVKTLPSPASSNDKLLPHYLRASTSSCHDYCKYGHKHVVQAKKWDPYFGRLSLSNDIRHEELNKMEVSTVRVRSKRPELKLRTTLTQDKLPRNSHVIKQKIKKGIQLSDATRNLEEESSEDSDSFKALTPSPFHESKVSLGHKPFGEGEDLSDAHKNIDAESYDESESIKRTSPSPMDENIVFLELESSSPVEKDIVSHVPTTLTWSIGSSDRSMSMESEISSPVEGSSEIVIPLRVVEGIDITRSKLKAPTSVTKSLTPKASLFTRNSVASNKLTPPSRSEKPSEVGQSVALSADHRSFAENKEHTRLKSPKMGEEKEREMTKLKTEATKEKRVSVKGLKSLQVGEGKIRKAMKLKIAPQLKKVVSDRAEGTRGKNAEVTENANVIKKSNPVEKTKRSVKLKSTEKETVKLVSLGAARSSFSPKLKTPVVKSTSALVTSELVIDDDEETKINEPVRSQRGVADEQRSRGIVTSETDDKNLSPHRLSFSRGKVVSPQSESVGPRRLRFRQARADDNHIGKEVGRRSFRKRRGSFGSVAELSTPVVLRHQGVQEKKAAQGLFNHVIEETASKLVETRKSKVKALVGAFETVISLQESRV